MQTLTLTIDQWELVDNALNAAWRDALDAANQARQNSDETPVIRAAMLLTLLEDLKAHIHRTWVDANEERGENVVTISGPMTVLGNVLAAHISRLSREEIYDLAPYRALDRQVRQALDLPLVR